MQNMEWSLGGGNMLFQKVKDICEVDENKW